MIVHGIPGLVPASRDGDTISVDIGVTLDGWVADAARTFAVGEVEAEESAGCSPSPRNRCTLGSSNASTGNRLGESPARSSSVGGRRGSRWCARSSDAAWGQHARGSTVPDYGKPGKAAF